MISGNRSKLFDMGIAERRHGKILEAMENQQLLSVEEAMRLTGASAATIRRDFDYLARENLVQRLRGGARLLQRQLMMPFALRAVHMEEQKCQIAQKVAMLLQPGDVVIIDGGTTTAQLAKYLPDIPLCIVTNSLRLASLLDQQTHRRAALEVLVTGGQLYPSGGILLGPTVIASLARYHAKWAFISVVGITTDGIYNNNEAVVEVQQQMLASAEHTVVLADHTKIGRRALCRVCALQAIDLATDANPKADATIRKIAQAVRSFIPVTAGSALRRGS